MTALNAKYIHSSLAIRYLEKYCNRYQEEKNYSIQIKEFSINESLDQIMAEIYESRADVLAFSVYIWNVEHTLSLIDRLKKVLPEAILVAGGPEVSYDPVEILEENPALDLIVKGEGEETFRNCWLCWQVRSRRSWRVYRGLFTGIRGPDQENPERELIRDLDRFPSLYRGRTG